MLAYSAQNYKYSVNLSYEKAHIWGVIIGTLINVSKSVFKMPKGNIRVLCVSC